MTNQDRFPTKYYRALLEHDDDGRVVCTCAELAGVVTDGATEDEALVNAVEAVGAYLESEGRPHAFGLMAVDA